MEDESNNRLKADNSAVSFITSTSVLQNVSIKGLT
jgi:hypothetical protein